MLLVAKKCKNASMSHLATGSDEGCTVSALVSYLRGGTTDTYHLDFVLWIRAIFEFQGEAPPDLMIGREHSLHDIDGLRDAVGVGAARFEHQKGAKDKTKHPANSPNLEH